MTIPDPFTTLAVQCIDAPASAPHVTHVDFATDTLTSYSGDEPPMGFPRVARVSDGVIDVEFAPPITLIGVRGLDIGSTPQTCHPEITSPRVVRVRVLEHPTGEPAPNAFTNLNFWKE